MTSGIDLSRGAYATGTLRFALITDAGMLAAALVNLSLYGRLQSGHTLADSQLAAMEEASAIVGALNLLGMLAAAVFFVRWLLQARRNVDALGARGLVHAHKWALWGWFVPIFNLFRPYQVVEEIWRGSDPQPGRPLAILSESTPVMLPVWWGCWLVRGVLGQFAFRRQVGLGDTPDVAGLIHVERLLATGAALSVVAAVLAIRVVRGIDGRQRARAARLDAETRHPWEPALA